MKFSSHMVFKDNSLPQPCILLSNLIRSLPGCHSFIHSFNFFASHIQNNTLTGYPFSLYEGHPFHTVQQLSISYQPVQLRKIHHIFIKLTYTFDKDDIMDFLHTIHSVPVPFQAKRQFHIHHVLLAHNATYRLCHHHYYCYQETLSCIYCLDIVACEDEEMRWWWSSWMNSRGR